MNLTAPGVLSHQTLHGKLFEIEKPKQRLTRELARKNGELKSELEAAKRKIARVDGDVGSKRRAMTRSVVRRKEGVVAVAGVPRIQWPLRGCKPLPK